jgi:hypothetical protein
VKCPQSYEEHMKSHIIQLAKALAIYSKCLTLSTKRLRNVLNQLANLVEIVGKLVCLMMASELLAPVHHNSSKDSMRSIQRNVPRNMKNIRSHT